MQNIKLENFIYTKIKFTKQNEIYLCMVRNLDGALLFVVLIFNTKEKLIVIRGNSVGVFVMTFS